MTAFTIDKWLVFYLEKGDKEEDGENMPDCDL